METLIPNRLSTLGHPHRLALFRLLMRRFPDRVPATELAQALGLKPNTLSTYVNALMQTGLISQERVGTSLRYAIDMDAARETVEYILHDCCRGRPEICVPTVDSHASGDSPLTDKKYNVLFICTGNSARSIFAESILRNIAGDQFIAFSAGTKPRSELNPFALEVLEQKGTISLSFGPRILPNSPKQARQRSILSLRSVIRPRTKTAPRGQGSLLAPIGGCLIPSALLGPTLKKA